MDPIIKRCIECGGRRFKRSAMANTTAISGVEFETAMPASTCIKCGQQYSRLADMEPIELGISFELAVRGVRTGEAFRYMRKALGLRAVDLAVLLDVSAETISRWETGAPEALAFTVLGSLIADRKAGHDRTAERLRALKQKPKPARVQVSLSPKKRSRRAA
jgi:hypothetical protein